MTESVCDIGSGRASVPPGVRRSSVVGVSVGASPCRLVSADAFCVPLALGLGCHVRACAERGCAVFLNFLFGFVAGLVRGRRS